MSSPAEAGPGAITITIPPNIALLTGPQLLGLYFNWGLLGVLGTQVYIYYLCFPRDSRYIKVLVYGIFIAEIAQTCMISSDGFHWLIYGWGHPERLEDYQLTWFDVPLMAGIISATVQIFFAWRIYVLGRSMLLSGIIVIIALVQACGGIAAGIQQKSVPSFAEVGKFLPAGSVWLGGSALVDIIIAVSMTYLLSKAKNGFHNTNYLVQRLVRLTIETGILTATVATVDLILFNIFKTNNLHMCPAFVLAKLYSNTMMVIFNQRIFISRKQPLSTAGSTTSGRLEPSTFYSSQIKDAMSQSPNTTAIKSFRDTFDDADESEGDIPMNTMRAHGSDTSKGRKDNPSGRAV